jgi:hypothetical protein
VDHVANSVVYDVVKMKSKKLLNNRNMKTQERKKEMNQSHCSYKLIE